MPQSRYRFIPLAILALVCVAPASAGADDVRLPVGGTRVKVTPPTGFVTAAQFPGFQENATGASIMVSEMPAPADLTIAGFSKESLLSRGMTLLSSERTNFGAHDGVLLAIAQSAQGIEFHKWIGVFGHRDATALVVATWPASSDAVSRAPLRKAVLSARLDAAAEPAPVTGPSFELKETGELRIAGRMAGMVTLSLQGKKVSTPSEPIVVAGFAINKADTRNLKTFSEQRLAWTEHIQNIQGVTGRATSIAGRPAYELTARALDTKTGEPMLVYQVVVPERGSYFLLQGLVGRSDGEKYLPQFKAIAASVTFEDPQ
ncbi:MAG: hypothetical protein WBV82_23480 [Myxococcaceae bacterium]